VNQTKYALLVLQALWQLFRYDLRNTAFGFESVHGGVARQRIAQRSLGPGLEASVCDAVCLAACFYWRPVLCLQRSVAATLLLRQYGINGRLVIGYRAAPFFSHAWVEVEGRVVNDSPAYKERLQILCVL
jgi:hypothetical protein